MEQPPKGYFRLGPGLKTRLKHAYIVECTDYQKDSEGNITEVHCTYIPESKSGNDTSGVKVKGTIHWLDSNSCVTAEVRLYDRLFKVEDPSNEDGDFKSYLNEESLTIIQNALVEPALKSAQSQDRFQFLRNGYFCVDPDSGLDHLIFNKTVGLKDSWAKEQKKNS
jgi:glutaminyl-tRNA synthetase